MRDRGRAGRRSRPVPQPSALRRAFGRRGAAAIPRTRHAACGSRHWDGAHSTAGDDGRPASPATSASPGPGSGPRYGRCRRGRPAARRSPRTRARRRRRRDGRAQAPRASSSVRAETSIHSTVSASASCGGRPGLMPWPLALPFEPLPFVPSGSGLAGRALRSGPWSGRCRRCRCPASTSRCRSVCLAVRLLESGVVLRGSGLILPVGDALVVQLAEHQVLLADTPDVRHHEVEGCAGVEAETDEREEDREDLRHRLHLRVRRACCRSGAGGPASGAPGTNR